MASFIQWILFHHQKKFNSFFFFFLKTCCLFALSDELDSRRVDLWNFCNTCSKYLLRFTLQTSCALSILNCCTKHLFTENGSESDEDRTISQIKAYRKKPREERNSNNNIIIKHTKGWMYWVLLRFLYFFFGEIISSYCESISETIALRSATELIWWSILRLFKFMTFRLLLAVAFVFVVKEKHWQHCRVDRLKVFW